MTLKGKELKRIVRKKFFGNLWFAGNLYKIDKVFSKKDSQNPHLTDLHELQAALNCSLTSIMASARLSLLDIQIKAALINISD